jgi:hypothetical protein
MGQQRDYGGTGEAAVHPTLGVIAEYWRRA